MNYELNKLIENRYSEIYKNQKNSLARTRDKDR
jgi:hypothetical protein